MLHYDRNSLFIGKAKRKESNAREKGRDARGERGGRGRTGNLLIFISDDFFKEKNEGESKKSDEGNTTDTSIEDRFDSKEDKKVGDP